VISGDVRDLVAFVTTLADLAGGPEQAGHWISLIQQRGLHAFRELGLTTDSRVVAERQALELRLVDAEGRPQPVRLAQLVIVLDIVAAVPSHPQTSSRIDPLVFTVPSEVADMLAPRQRLDLLVADVIRNASTTLDIGGPFWNAEGFQLLRPVLEPALSVRGVQCTFYVHQSGTEYDDQLQRFVSNLGHPNQIRVWWYRSASGGLMHAKFCVADGREGYLGTANLTSLGLGRHIEIGVKLSSPQCVDLLHLLQGLVQAGLFT
jgi:hypothetical protein